jgi:BMFP domain-containing protein YqiC
LIVRERVFCDAFTARTNAARLPPAGHRVGAAGTMVNRLRRQGIEMNEKLLGEIAARLAEAAASNPARDLEKNARAVLATAFARLDLVTREEFDVQSEVLARARIRVAELEAKVAALEARFATKP